MKFLTYGISDETWEISERDDSGLSCSAKLGKQITVCRIMGGHVFQYDHGAFDKLFPSLAKIVQKAARGRVHDVIS